MSRTYLLTGGTGFLGSFLSAELIKRGDRIVFMGRSRGGESFQDRIKKSLGFSGLEFSSDDLDTVEADLSKERLEFSDEDVKKFKGKIDGIWHLAANLSFKEGDRKDIFNVNVGGLKNILNLADKIKSPVYYISTAYVHGRRPGVVFENELIKPNSFNNPYEESKFEAEKIIRKWMKDKSGRFIVFRPSILIEEKIRRLSFFGYYAVVYSLYRMRKKFGQKVVKIFMPFPYSGRSFLNLMPVDTAVKWMLEITSNHKSIGKTFHITNPAPFSMKDIVKQTFDALNIRIPVFRSPKWFIKACFNVFYFFGFFIKSIRGISRKFYYYKYYMTEYNVYDMKNTKEIVGQDEISQLRFSRDFIKNIAQKFIKKIEQ